MENLTMDRLNMIADAVLPVIRVHPDETEHATVKTLRDAGYAVETSEYMPKGLAWFSDITNCGIVDLKAGTAFVSKNTINDWILGRREPPQFTWPPR